MRTIRLWVLISAVLGLTIGAVAQSPLTPIPQLRGRTDSNGSLYVVSATEALPQTPLTAIANLRGRTDSSGSLYVVGAGAGTVTSVAMTVPSFLSVAGSPVTTTGTLAVTLATETANTLFAGPTTGGAVAPTFRAMVAADVAFAAAGVTTWMTTPSSANFATALTDETGSGPAVFATAPTFTSANAVKFGAAGVSLTDNGDGAITFQGLGNGSAESLILDLDNYGADIVDFRSTTSANDFRFTSEAALGTFFDIQDYTANAGNMSELRLMRYRGTTGSPSTVLNGDSLGKVAWGGWDGSNISKGVQIVAQVSGTPAAGHIPSALAFQVDNASALVTNMVLLPSGAVSIGNSTGVDLSASNGTLTMLGAGNGQDENLTWDFNTTSNQVTVASGTSVSKIVFTSISLQPNGYNSSDGSAGVTGATCSAWKNGLCTTALPLPEVLSLTQANAMLGARVKQLELDLDDLRHALHR